MGRFGPITARFYSLSDIDTPLNQGGTTHQAVSGSFDDNDSGMGQASLVFVNNSDLNTLAAQGNLCWAVKTDAVRTDLGDGEVTFAEPFIINERITIPGTDMIEIRGPLLHSDLTRWTIYRPLGAETVYNTTLAEAAAAPDTGRTLSATATAGADSFQVSAASDADVGRELRVKMNNLLWFISEIRAVRESGGNKYLDTVDRLPSTATSGNNIEIRIRKIKVAAPAGLAAGQEITVTLNSGSHQTLIDEGPSGDIITLRDSIPSLANSGKAVQVKDYSQPATNDVTQIITGFTSGWTVEFETGTGTAGGTRYPGGGETVYSILRSIADETGEQFRLKSAEASPKGPKRKIVWRRTPDTAGVSGTVRLVMPAQADMAAAIADKNRAILIERPRHAGHYDPVTQVIPVAGDARVTLFSCSAAALSAASSAGFSVTTTGLGLYAAPYVTNTALNGSIGLHQRRVTFSEVTVEGDNVASIQSAADRLLSLAINYLNEHTDAAREITARCISAIGIRPGQKVEMVFDAPTGEYSINYTSPSSLYVQSVRRESSPDGDYPGAPITTLKLTPSKYAVPTANAEVGKRLAAVERLAAKAASPQLINTAVAFGSGSGALPGGGGSPPVGSYLPLTGGTMSGNIAFSGSQTVDGVDISAHAANASAHHAPVTAGDNSINLSGQAVSVKRPAASGLKLDATGVYLDPSTLTAATTNAVSGSGHTHAVTTTPNAKATVNTILQGDSNGDLTTRYFTADKVTTPRVETSSGALTLAPASSSLAVNAHVAFDGARDITTASGNLTLKPAANLSINPTGNVAELQASTTLKTNHWSSGFMGTGWGVLYNGNADFRNIYADELHVAAFIADTARVKVGSEYITPSMALVSRGFTIPAVSGTGTLYVEDAPGLDNLPVFANEDWVLLRIMNRSGGGLSVQNAWGQVAGYADLASGEQSWTFTTRSAGSAVGQVAPRGSVALDYGISGDGWLWLTAIDPAGAPYLGMTTWQGDNPYTDANRTHQVRLGQLSGVTGQSEFGLQVGTTNTNHITLSNLRREFHGTRVSLYAARGGTLQLSAIDVRHYRTISTYSTLLPNADHLAEGLISTAGNYWSTIDEGAGTPNHSDYVANAPGTSGVLFVGLTNPTWNGNTVMVSFHAAIKTVNFSGDSVKLYAQVFTADQLTPLSGEVLVYTATSNTTTTVTVGDAARLNNATQAQWNGARLRLRWEYIIGDTAFEAIRLDPNVPSLAVGHPLPTGYEAGGDGFWVGRDAGTYKMRLGKASGVGLRWDGSTLAIRNSDNQNVIEMKSDGTSSFARPMSLGASGGIWQASTGTFAAPKSGLKIWNESGEGRLALFDSNGNQGVTLRHDRGIEIANAGDIKNSAGIIFSETPGGTPFGGLYVAKIANYNVANFRITDSGDNYTGFLAERYFTVSQATMYSADVRLSLNSTNKFLYLTGGPSYPSFYIGRGGIGVGYNPYSLPAIPVGVIAADLGGNSDNAQLVLQDTADIAHGMTDVASTSTYANFRKENNNAGGLLINGLAENALGLRLSGWGVGGDTNINTTGRGTVYINAAKRDGAGPGTKALNAGEIILGVGNYGSARFLVVGNGDFYYDGTGSAYDDHDDVSLLRTLSREMWGGTIDSVWDKFITTNRQNLIDAGIISDGGFINGAALSRLLTGAVWQLAEKIKHLEEKLA